MDKGQFNSATERRWSKSKRNEVLTVKIWKHRQGLPGNFYKECGQCVIDNRKEISPISR